MERVGYQPFGKYNLDIEVFRVAELWPRQKAEQLRRAHRIDFHQLLYVTEGRCAHVVDFGQVDCVAGTILMTRPGQAQQFDTDGAWDGWLLLFQSDFLLPSGAAQAGRSLAPELAWLGQPMQLDGALQQRVADSVAQLHRDTQLPAVRGELHALLRHQLHALLIRLAIAWGEREAASAGHPVSAGERQRYRRFLQLVEQRFRHWHQVQDYAAALGCSDKSLNRAAQAFADCTAKAVIVERIMLEAKRLLAHTALPVAVVGGQVGFDEATNFTKFFRREALMSPGAFRALHQLK
ncbi:hypothetical protein ASF61_21100 [Duganella sp. Leaf126]|uniref:helix-turn-helix domain-containing protein n=1 Tax=Duganella sp. Leaf126 TaxID=1736266 RepID=UPI0006F7EB85|nr:AraC family transcriptional regulator [Duganella sp. Leaf126]KQQ45126.1 hypothetical protein ASF61_21100 [Duganella sp. Leaf126]